MVKSKSPADRTRGRPQLSDAEMMEVRQRIADCALKLFREKGYDAISMRRLASEAGCTVMTLYRYFDRKIDILRMLWADVFSELFDELEQIAAQEADPTRRLETVAFGYLEFWLKRRDHYFLVFMSSGITQSDVSIFVEQDDVVARFSLLRTCVADALAEDPASSGVDLKTQLLMCALNGIAHNLITISAYPWADPKALVQSAVSGVVNA